MSEPIAFTPIGVIHSPFTDIEGMPIQASTAVGVQGWIDLDPTLVEGLRDLGGFSHLILIYHLDRVRQTRLIVTPFLDDQKHGIFATRAPARPNPIGLSTVRLVDITGSRLAISDVDVVDGTPLLDIKPYVPAFDQRDGVRAGWYDSRLAGLPTTRADDRFR